MTAAAVSRRIASGERGLGFPFGPVKKGTGTRSGRKLCTCFSLQAFGFALPGFDLFGRSRPKSKNQRQGLRAVARPAFVLAKASKTAFAGREPMRCSRIGALCSSPDAAHWDLYGSAAQTRCAQTWAALRPRPAPARLALRLDWRSRAEGKKQGKDQKQSNSNSNSVPHPMRCAR